MARTMKMTTFIALLAVVFTAALFMLPVAAGAEEAPQLTLECTDMSLAYGDDLSFSFDALADSGNGLESVLGSCTAADFELWYADAALDCTIDTANKTIVCAEDINAGTNTFTLKYVGTSLDMFAGATTTCEVSIAKAVITNISVQLDVPVAGQPLDTTPVILTEGIDASGVSVTWYTQNEEGEATIRTDANYGDTLYANIDGMLPLANYEFVALSSITCEANTEEIVKGKNSLTGAHSLTLKYARLPLLEVQSIEIEDFEPTYYYDEKLDYSDIDIKVTYTDGSTEVLGVKKEMVTADKTEAIGTQTITVTYGGKSASFDIEVINYSTPWPVFSPERETFTNTVTVSISVPDLPDAVIYYTTDGTDPTESSTVYTAPFTVNETTTIKAIAKYGTYELSDIETMTYTKRENSPAGGGSAGGSGGGGGGGRGSSSSSTGGVYVPSAPDLNGKPMSWSAMAEALAKLPRGSEITIKLHGNYEVPVEVITAIADNELKVTFFVDNARSWYLDGADIEKPCAADLRVAQNSDIDASELSGLVGTRFSVDGTDIPTDLITSFRKKHAGRFAYLYQKTADGFVFNAAARIGEDGKVSFPLSEGGDYVIMIKDYSPVFGDANNDGLFTQADAMAVLMECVDYKVELNREQLDFNGDGIVTPADASAILRAL